MVRQLYEEDAVIQYEFTKGFTWKAFFSDININNSLNDLLKTTNMIKVDFVNSKKVSLDYSSLKSVLRKRRKDNSQIMYLLYDNVYEEEIIFITDLVLVNRVLVVDSGNNRYFMGEKANLDYDDDCISTLAYVAKAKVGDNVYELIFPVTEENSKKIKEELEGNKIIKITGMKISSVLPKTKSGSYSLDKKESILINSYDSKEDTFEDVKKMVPKLKSYDDFGIFRDSGTGKPLYSEILNTLLFFCVFYVRKGEPPFNIIFSGIGGSGKCHGAGTKIMMYDGSIKNVEDVKKGDELMGDDSTPRKVLSLARGRENMYNIKQRNGDDYTINESHVLSLKWAFYKYKKNVSKEKKQRRFEQGECFDISLKDYFKESQFFKDIARGYKVPLKFNHKKVFDPYFLGLWLGDGSSRSCQISTPDIEIMNYLEGLSKKLDMNCKISEMNKLRGNKAKSVRLMNKAGVHDKKYVSKNKFYYNKLNYILAKEGVLNNKHIPSKYKYNSKKNRLLLLAGLIDSDGYVPFKKNERGIQIIQKNTRLAKDIVFLARSLGFKVSINNKKIAHCQNDFVGVYNSIYITGAIWNIPLKIKRKKEATNNCNKQTKWWKDVLTTSFKVEPLGEGDYYGFTLDGNGRYLLGDFTVTHNTSAIKFLSKVFSNDGSIIVANMSTAKGLVPSYGDKPRPGLLIEPENYIKVVDEFFRRAEKEALSKGMKDATPFVYNFLTEAMNVVERRADVLAGSGKGSLRAGMYMKDSFLATDNLNPGVRVALSTAVSQDKAVMRRFTFLLIRDEEVENLKLATEFLADDEYFESMEKYCRYRGYSLKQLRRLTRWMRLVVTKIKVNRSLCKKISEELTAELIAEVIGVDKGAELVQRWVSELNIIPYFEALVRCCSLSRNLFEEQEQILPESIVVLEQDYDLASRYFRRLFGDTFEVYKNGILDANNNMVRGIQRFSGGFQR